MNKPNVVDLRTKQISEDVLEQCANQFSTYDWYLICKLQTLSESFMEKYSEKMVWEEVCCCQKFSLDFAIKFKLYKYVGMIAQNDNSEIRKMAEDLLKFRNTLINESKLDDLLVFLRLMGNNRIKKEHLLYATGFDGAMDDEDGAFLDILLLSDERVEVVGYTYEEDLINDIKQRLRDDLMLIPM